MIFKSALAWWRKDTIYDLYAVGDNSKQVLPKRCSSFPYVGMLRLLIFRSMTNKWRISPNLPLRILLIYTSTILHTPVSLLCRTLSIQLIHIAFPVKLQPIKLELLKLQLLSILLTWWKFSQSDKSSKKIPETKCFPY